MNKKIVYKPGFSLAEMMIVMLILSIVLAAATPIITRRVIAGEQAKDVSAIPAGIVNSFAGIQIPDGWLLCNGQAVSRGGNYADLYNAIGTTFGSGDGASTFNVPNLVGRVIIGDGQWNDIYGSITYSLGSIGGERSHKLTINELPSHSHSLSNYLNLGGSGGDISWGGDARRTWNNTNTGNIGGDQVHNNMPPYVAINYIIKY